MMNGAEAGDFLPNPGNLAALSPITEPLKKWWNLVTVIKGVNIAGSMNHYAVRSTYCGADIGNYEAADPTVPSIDQLVADNIAATAATPIRSMHLGVIPADSINGYKRAGRSTFFFAPAAVDYEANPVTAFDRSFGGAAGPALSAAADFTADSMDVIEAEMSDLVTRLGSSTEVAKLTMHGEALKSLRPRTRDQLAAMIKPAPSVGTLPSVEKLRVALQDNAKDAYKSAYFSDLFDAQVDNMARALVSGQTRVATLQAGSADNNVIVPVDKGYPHHNTSHGNQAIYAQVQKWYFGKLARLAAALDVPDPLDPGGKSVLQNTLIVVMAECLPISHSSMGVPTLLLGTAAGKIRPGFVNDDGVTSATNRTNRTNRTVMATVLKAFNLGPAHFGGEFVSEILA